MGTPGYYADTVRPDRDGECFMTSLSAQQIPTEIPTAQPIGANDLARSGYAHLPAETIGLTSFDGWPALRSQWDGMGPDVYLKAVGYRRQRRYARLSTGLDGPGEVTVAMLPTEPFVQHTPDNPRFDGVPRHFEPCDPALLGSPAFRYLLAVDLAAIGTAGHGWEVGVHQMRVLWNGTNIAEATPEGRHSDGHLFVAIHLIGLSPSTGGSSQVFDSRTASAPVFTTRLKNPGDTLIVNDRQMLHQVTSLTADAPGVRDVLVVDFLRERYVTGEAR